MHGVDDLVMCLCEFYGHMGSHIDDLMAFMDRMM